MHTPLLLLACLLITSCAQPKATFDHRAYDRSVERTAQESFNQRLANP
ncbi:MAG: hypothetical protein SNJ84_04275 [Verrucomicrobiia bacterium]